MPLLPLHPQKTNFDKKNKESKNTQKYKITDKQVKKSSYIYLFVMRFFFPFLQTLHSVRGREISKTDEMFLMKKHEMKTKIKSDKNWLERLLSTW